MSDEKKTNPGSPEKFVQPDPDQLSDAELTSVAGDRRLPVAPAPEAESTTGLCVAKRDSRYGWLIS